jgi:hypothetical protein
MHDRARLTAEDREFCRVGLFQIRQATQRDSFHLCQLGIPVARRPIPISASFCRGQDMLTSRANRALFHRILIIWARWGFQLLIRLARWAVVKRGRCLGRSANTSGLMRTDSCCCVSNSIDPQDCTSSFASGAESSPNSERSALSVTSLSVSSEPTNASRTFSLRRSISGALGKAKVFSPG